MRRLEDPGHHDIEENDRERRHAPSERCSDALRSVARSSVRRQHRVNDGISSSLAHVRYSKFRDALPSLRPRRANHDERPEQVELIELPIKPKTGNGNALSDSPPPGGELVRPSVVDVARNAMRSDRRLVFSVARHDSASSISRSASIRKTTSAFGIAIRPSSSNLLQDAAARAPRRGQKESETKNATRLPSTTCSPSCSREACRALQNTYVKHPQFDAVFITQ